MPPGAPRRPSSTSCSPAASAHIGTGSMRSRPGTSMPARRSLCGSLPQDSHRAQRRSALTSLAARSRRRWSRLMPGKPPRAPATGPWSAARWHRDLNLPDSSSRRRRSEEHTSELQSPDHLVCRLLLEKKKKKNKHPNRYKKKKKKKNKKKNKKMKT